MAFSANLWRFLDPGGNYRLQRLVLSKIALNEMLTAWSIRNAYWWRYNRGPLLAGHGSKKMIGVLSNSRLFYSSVPLPL